MKTCRTCKEAKDESGFYPNDGMCKPCRCAKVRANRNLRIGYYQNWDRERSRTPERKQTAAEYQRVRRARFPEKNLARQRLMFAIKSKKVVRPDRCPECKAVGPVQAHHTDYSKPLDVVWVCFKCHREKYHGQRVSA